MSIPQKAKFSKIPNKTDVLAYGGCLFNAASCSECHSKQEKGKPIVGRELAGGFEFPLIASGIVRSANITQDKETGIGKWTQADSVNRFKMYAADSYGPNKIEKEILIPLCHG